MRPLSDIRAMRTLSAGAVVALVAILCVGGSQAMAQSQPMSAAEAQQKLTALRVWNAQLLQQSPKLMDVEAAITGDCMQKLEKGRDPVNYCSCARATVMYLWLNVGNDKQMVARVQSYAVDPKGVEAADFLQYQGPELYKPFCDLAVGVS